MLSKIVVAGLLLVALYASIVAAESVITASPFDKFRIGIARYENPQCKGNADGPTKSMERYDNHNISPGECHSWEDDRPFMSFSYWWRIYGSWQKVKHLPGYGNCEILLYNEAKCFEPAYIGKFENVNVERYLGSCVSFRGPARSAKLVCKKGESA